METALKSPDVSAMFHMNEAIMVTYIFKFYI
jgi:hypothetical protein